MRRAPPRRAAERGSILMLAMFFVLVLAVVGVLVVRHAGRDRIASAQLVSKERAFACAEAGLQYGRRFFGMRYATSNGWNDYLNGTQAGFFYDPTTSRPNLSSVPLQTRGASDGTNYEAGTLYNGLPTFWVSVRDDDDEIPAGLTTNIPTRDNNETIIIRSECTAFFYVEGGQDQTAVIEALLANVQSGSGYGNAQITSNSTDVMGRLGN